MGAKPSSTVLFNEYQSAYNTTVDVINQKLPMVQEKIKETINLFSPFISMTEKDVQNKYTILNKTNPIPFTFNVYEKIDSINNKINSFNPPHNNKSPPNNKNDIYTRLYEWGKDMYDIFTKMNTNITDMSEMVNKIYPSISSNTYPAVKELLETYSYYIYKCYMFCTYKGDIFNHPKILLDWKEYEEKQFRSFKNLYENISRFTPPQRQVQISPGVTVPTIEQQVQVVQIPVPRTNVVSSVVSNENIKYAQNQIGKNKK